MCGHVWGRVDVPMAACVETRLGRVDISMAARVEKREQAWEREARRQEAEVVEVRR